MIVFDNITIYICTALVLLAAVTPLLNPFFRGRKLQTERTSEPATDGQEDNTQQLPKVSIILTPHENAPELEANLPLLLNQQYSNDYKVIVVAWKSDSETEDVLKRFLGHQRLYTTFIPDSSRYMSRKKLAITLGAKASKYEWLLFTDIDCKPQGDQWLATMARNCTTDKDLVIGYTRYDDETPAYRRFERLHTSYYLMREDLKGTAYRTNSNNLMLRKSIFMEQEGFRGNLKYLRGEYDFLVNKFAGKDNTALEIHPDAWLTEQAPTDKSWRNKHLFYRENRLHMKRSAMHRFLFNLDQWAMHLTYLSILAAIIFSIITQRWIITGVAVISLLAVTIIRSIIGQKAMSRFNEDIGKMSIVPYELSIVWHQLSYWMKYKRADKYDFISHKL